MSKRFERFNKLRKRSQPNFKPVFVVQRVQTIDPVETKESTESTEPKNPIKIISDAKVESRDQLKILVTCPICHKTFDSKKESNLRRHMKLHNQVQEQFKCRVCGRQYQTHGNFNAHKKVQHAGIDPKMIFYEKVPIKAKGTIIYQYFFY